MFPLQTKKSRSHLRNLAKIFPYTLEVFGVNPDNMQNAFDGKSSTQTGVGTKTLTGSGTAGVIKFDFGSEKTVLVGVMVGIGATSGTTTVYVDFSNSSDFSNPFTVSVTSANSAYEVKKHGQSIGTARYVRVRFTGSAASDVSMSLYELGIWEL
jgi:hypothetical protein